MVMEKYTSLNEIFMLGVPEDRDSSIEFINGSDHIGTGEGKLLPVDKGFFSNFTEDGFGVLFDRIDLDL